MRKHTATLFAVFVLLAAAPGGAADDASTQGEITEIRHGGSAGNQGAVDQLTIRTRNGETRQLLLGRSDSCPGCFRVGDRVRAQVMAGDDQGAAQRVRSMKVRRTGETLAFRNESGELVRTRSRSEHGAGQASANGAGANQRERMHQSGAQGACGGRTRHRSR